MGEAITVRSAVGEGTTFTVQLPVRKFEGELVTAESKAEAAALGDPRVAKRDCRVPIAEDHDINQEMILGMARRAGMDPTIASDGRRQLPRWRRQHERASRSHWS